MYAPKEESLVSIENIRATRRNMRKLPNIDIANWILEQQQLRQKIQKRRSTNLFIYLRGYPLLSGSLYTGTVYMFFMNMI